jgi:hypothetical protein
MPKTREQMSDVEKIEDLRRDVVRLFDAVNEANRRLRSAEERLNQVEEIASGGAKTT